MIDILAFALMCERTPDPDLVPMIETAAIAQGIEPELLAALVVTESRCVPDAKSSEGAVGYTQIVPRVWKHKASKMGLDIYDPKDNLQMGAWILKSQLHKGAFESLRRYHGYKDNEASKRVANAYARSVIGRREKLPVYELPEEQECICTPETCSTTSTSMIPVFASLPLVMSLMAATSWLWALVTQKKLGIDGQV